MAYGKGYGFYKITIFAYGYAPPGSSDALVFGPSLFYREQVRLSPNRLFKVLLGKLIHKSL
jgi:hypothetical protein